MNKFMIDNGMEFDFGKTSKDEDIYSFNLSNRNDMKVTIINYGATILSIVVKDKNGEYADVVLGYDSLESMDKTCGKGGVYRTIY